MSLNGPTKQEIESVFNRLRTQAANKCCFDCGAKSPTWSSVTYGIFICIDCSAVHRNLGVHLTFVRSINLDTNWTWLQLRQMQLGGNANASQFFRQHNCNTTDAQQKYNSRAAQLYRDKLLTTAQNAMKQHGTKLHLDNQHEKTENEVNKTQEDDFFGQCDDGFDVLNQQNNNLVKIESTTKTVNADLQTSMESGSGILGTSVSDSILTPGTRARKIQPKKTGIGAKKGGLGATKVKTNFAELEQRANLANQFRDQVVEKKLTEEEELESVENVRLAYQDLSLKKEKEEEKLKSIDPMKAKQMERLGMGFNLKGSTVSHSAISDMQTITQTSGSKLPASSSKSSFDRESSADSLLGYTPSMYSSTKQDKELEMMGFEPIDTIDVTTMFGGQSKPRVANSDQSSTANRKPFNINHNKSSPSNDTSETTAQRKFGGAKGISSDQFFGNDNQSQSDSSVNLSRFQGSNSISSSDYFGDSSSTTSSRSSRRGYSTAVNFNAPDLEDVKESVRQGVTKVAGRLSSLASDVMSTLQDKYGY